MELIPAALRLGVGYTVDTSPIYNMANTEMNNHSQ